MAATPAQSVPAPRQAPAAPKEAPAPPVNRPRLGELLVHEGVITQNQLADALKKQSETGSFIGQSLVELGYITHSTLVSFLVKQCRIPHISLLDYNVGEDLFKLIPKELCKQYRLLPIDKLGKILTVAMVDPLDAEALENVRAVCPELKLKPILCDWQHFNQVASRVFEPTGVPAPAEVSMGTFGLSTKRTSAAEPVEAKPVEKNAVDAAVEQLVKEVNTPKQAPARAPEHAPQAAPSATPRASAEPQHVTSVQMPEAMLERLGERMRTAFAETMSPLIAEQQKLIALQLETTSAKPNELAREIAANMRSALQDALLPMLEAQGKMAAHQGAAQFDTGALAKQLGDSVRTAMVDSVLPLLQAMDTPEREIQFPPAAQALDTAMLARDLGESVRAAIAETVEPLMRAAQSIGTQTGAPAPTPPALDTKALAKEIAAGLRAAVVDAIVPLAKNQEAAASAGQRVPEEIAKAFAQHIDRNMASLAKDLRETIAASQPHFDDFAGRIATSLESAGAAQNNRIAELTDATKSALTAVREALDVIREQHAQPMSAMAANVAPFPGLRAADPVPAGNIPHFDPMEEIGLGVDADDRVRDALCAGRLQRFFTFDAFLSGAANTFTLSVARAVTERFSREFTPFYIYGDVGVGKTHVLQAIGNAMQARNPDLRVGYMTGLRFVSACERAGRDQELEKFRESFAHYDALLFDDAQSVAAHKQAQDELRTVLGVLTHEGRLVVVSADRAPDQLPEMSHQLVSRLSAGIVSRLHAPDMPTRVAILQRHARVLGTVVTEDVLSLIAARVPSDVRKMTGALRKALAYAQVSGTEVTHELAEEILSHLNSIEAA